MHDAGIELPAEPGLPGSGDPYPPVLVVPLEKVETLRYGENPHQPAARYRRTGPRAAPGDGPFATGEPPLQGKALSYNNVLDASAAAAARRGSCAARRSSSSSTPTRAAPRSARRCSRPGRPRSRATRCRRSAGVVALTRDGRPRRSRSGSTSIFLEVVVAPAFDDAALEVLAAKPNLRLVVDPSLDAAADRSGHARGLLAVDYLGSVRTAGGAVLVDRARHAPRRPGRVDLPHHAPPDATRERRDLDLAWRLCRGVVSNAIVLVRDGDARSASAPAR